MPFEVKAAFGLLIDLIFIRDGRLPDDARFIAGYLGLSVRKWNLIRTALLEWPNADGSIGKIRSDLGIITTLKSDYLTINRRLSGDNNEINEAEGNKNSNLTKSRASARERVLESEPESKITTATSASDDWPDLTPLDQAALLCRLVGRSGSLDVARDGGLVQSVFYFPKWRKRGASWEGDVVPVVTALTQRNARPIRTWSYFDQAIAEATAARTAPVKEGFSNGNEFGGSRARERGQDVDAMLSGAQRAIDDYDAGVSRSG